MKVVCLTPRTAKLVNIFMSIILLIYDFDFHSIIKLAFTIDKSKGSTQKIGVFSFF